MKKLLLVVVGLLILGSVSAKDVVIIKDSKTKLIDREDSIFLCIEDKEFHDYTVDIYLGPGENSAFLALIGIRDWFDMAGVGDKMDVDLGLDDVDETVEFCKDSGTTILVSYGSINFPRDRKLYGKVTRDFIQRAVMVLYTAER